MKGIRSTILAGSSALALGIAPLAQPALAQADPAAASDEASEDASIIVTARRREERLIDVPQTINTVSSQDLQDFNLIKFQDISNVVPGLTLDFESNRPTAQVRGVSFQVTAQGSPTVETYLNEVPLNALMVFQSNFDVGQIEVLRGPQGTLRGRSAPSGAITYNTRRPDLGEWGGHVNLLATDLETYNAQAALNVPIANDVLALRVAGLWENNAASRLRSVTNPDKPYSHTRAGRASLRFEPTPSLSANIVYQHLEKKNRDYGGTGQTETRAFFGNGAAGFVAGAGNCPNGGTVTANFTCSATAVRPAIFAPPGFNGPVLVADPDNLLTATDSLSFTEQNLDFVTGQANWHIGGQTLSYVGGWARLDSLDRSDGDGANTVPGRYRNLSRVTFGSLELMSHELRLSSDERLFDMIDYTIGGFYGRDERHTFLENLNNILTGAFGSPLGASAPGGPGLLSPFTYDPRYSIGSLTITDTLEVEKALFANAMLHLGEKTEISAGVRQIWKSSTKALHIDQNFVGLTAIQNPNGLGACPATLSSSFAATGLGTLVNAPVVGQTYPGTCDVQVTYNNGAELLRNGLLGAFNLAPLKRKFSPLVYNFSVSHKFTPDLMAYASYGTSWRGGPGPITGVPGCAGFSTVTAVDGSTLGPEVRSYCEPFRILDSEKSKGVEVGFKAALLDRRLNISVAYYHQKFDNFFVRASSSVPYLQGNCIAANLANTQVCSVANGVFTYNTDPKVDGVDAEVNFRVTPDFNVGALFAWSKSRFTNSGIPCRDTDAPGTPGAGVPDEGVNPYTTPTAWLNAGLPYGPRTCTVSGSASTAPPWNLTLRGEYSHDVFTGAKAFIRGLINYYPKNKNRPDAIWHDVSQTFVLPKAYALASMWVGVRDETGAWEVSLGARNLFNTRTMLTRDRFASDLINPQAGLRFAYPTLQNSGYRTVSWVAPREVQLSLRYAFGSR